MKTTKFKVLPLGGDNGSGYFETGGSLNTDRVEALAGPGEACFEQALVRAIAGALLSQVDNASDVTIVDPVVTKVGAHYLVSFACREPECGDQQFVFAATEVQ